MFAMVWIILAVFLVCAALMYTRKLSAILALPLMSVIIALLAMPDKPLDAIALVFETGAARLAKAMTNVIFGAALAHIVFTTGIAETLVKKAAELAGDRVLPVTIIMTMTTAVAFLALAGLGSVVMMGTLVLPILLGVGLRPLAAAGIFLFGISIGGMWNVANWGFYRDVLKLPLTTISSFAAIGGVSLIVATLVFIVLNARAPRVAWAAATTPPTPASATVPGISLITPLIPVLLILGFKYAHSLSGGRFADREFDINAALLIAGLYGILTTRPKAILNLLTGAFTEGIKTVAPVLALLIGIGMAVTALMAEPVKAAMEPLLRSVVPASPWGYVLFFGLLSPLALYRGPLNLYGLGAGVAAVLALMLPPALVMGALMCTGMIQGVCDPTNTHNVWTGGLTKTDVNDILKTTLPYAFAATFAALIVIAMTRW
jgi:C4-dicarboxylate transporter, DcuC family